MNKESIALHNCRGCGKELDCSNSGECYSDNPHALTHRHLGGIYCKECYAKTHPFCSICNVPTRVEWKYCPWCGSVMKKEETENGGVAQPG